MPEDNVVVDKQKYIVIENNSVRTLIVVEAESAEAAKQIASYGDIIERTSTETSSTEAKLLSEWIESRQPKTPPTVAMPDKTLVDPSGKPLENK